MHVHLPKPLHGWREFLGEVGIIVLGVLIALAADQLIERWNWSRKVAEARQRLAPELGEDLGQAALLDRSRPCIGRRLDELAEIVVQAQEDGRLPSIADPGRPDWFTWDTGVWQSLIADQTATHFPHDDLAGYTETYQFIFSIDEATKQETEAWTALAGLTGPGRRFDPGEANFYLQALGRARFLNRFISGAGVRALQTATAHALPIDTKVFRSFADLDPSSYLCKPVSRSGPSTYGQAPWKGVVEAMRAHPITSSSNGMK